uniref:Adenylate kinase 7 n=1 Tax=Lygus hesperus TaxID=30085 RepID=A0A0K8SVP4_LYGHE
MDETKPDYEPAEAEVAEVAGEESDEGITVKLPSGKTIKMITPFDDEGDVPWMVPKDERDLDFYEIPWDFLLDDDYRRSKQGKIVVLCRQKIADSWFEHFGNGVPHPDKVYKSRYDAFNGKHIIENILGEEIPKAPEKPDDITIPSVDKLAADSTPATPVLKKSKHHSKEKKTGIRENKRKKLHALLIKLQNLQILQEDEVPKVEKWFSTKIDREEKIEEEEKRRRRLKKKRSGRKELFASLWGDPGKKRDKQADNNEVYGEEQHGEEEGIGWGEFEEARGQRLTKVSRYSAPVDRGPQGGDLTGDTRSRSRLGTTDEPKNKIHEEGEEYEAEFEGEFGEEESLEDITFSDLEKEEEFLTTVEQRESHEKKERIEYLQRRQKRLYEKLKEKIDLEKSKITPEYVETLNILKMRDNQDYLLGWEPTLEFPYTTCIGNKNVGEPDKCHQKCYPKRGGKCRCSEPNCLAKNGGLCVNQPSDTESVNVDEGQFVTGMEARLPGKGPFMMDVLPKPLDQDEIVNLPENEAYMSLFPPKKESIPRTEHFCFSGKVNLTPFEMRNKYGLWLEELATYFDNIFINARIREAALAQGWVKSPYYQFGVDSGLILAPTDEIDKQHIEEFKRRPDYPAKKAEFGKILEDGMLSQERMQELLLLGVAEQDPFIRDYLDLAQSKRQWEQSENAEIEWNLENNPEVYDGEFPPDIMNPNVAEDELEEGEDELSPEDRLRKRKEDFLKSKVQVEMNFNQDKTLARWDDKRFLMDSKRRQEKMKELTGDPKSNMGDAKLKKIFGHCAVDYSFDDPKTFKEVVTRYEERLRKRVYPFAEDPKNPTEFQNFLAKWQEQWSRVKKVAVRQSLKNLKEYHKSATEEKLAMYERAFKKRLETCEVTGRPPKFLIKALLRKHERNNSYLQFLRRMKKAYLSQQNTDKKKLKKFISCVEKLLEIIDTEKRKKRDMKMAKIRRMGSYGGEEAEEDADFRRREISLKELERKQREKKKSNVDLIGSRKYTKEDFEARRFLKGPVKVYKEPKGMTEKQVRELLYAANTDVPLRPDIDPEVFFMKWYSDHRDNTPRKCCSELFKIDKRLGPSKNFSVVNYMSMLKAAEMVERDPYDLKFLPNAGHYLKPIYYMPDGMDVPVRMLANYPKEPKNFKEGDGVNIQEIKAEKPYFSDQLLDVWRSRTKEPERRKKLKISDLIKEEATKEGNKKKENLGGELDEDQESGVMLEPDGSETEVSEGGGEIANVLPEVKPKEPWTCPPLEPWDRFQYDPYACLRNKSRISRKERAWFRSARERESRAFRKGQTSFMKFIDVNKLNSDPENFKVWHMASSGVLYKALRVMNPNFEKDESLHGVGELWNWDNVGGGEDQRESKDQKSLSKFKSAYYFKTQNVAPDHKTDNIGAQFIKTMLEDYKMPPDHQIKRNNEEESDPPTSYVVFSSISLPPFLEQRVHNRRNIHNDTKVEDRKLFKVLNSCGTLIFDITRSRHDMYLCCWYLRKLLLKLEKAEQLKQTETDAKRKLVEKVLKNKKETVDQTPQTTELYRPMQRIILITSFVSWAKSPEDVKAEMKEQTFYKRKPHPEYFDYYTCENLLYRIGRRKPYNIHTTVLFSGLPFGFEEDGLVYVFKMAFEDRREIPIYGPGDNLPPMVHIHDLSKIVISLMKADKPPLIAFAIHPTDLPLKTRVFNIASQISYSHVRTQPTPQYLWNNILPKTVHDMLQLNITPDSVDNHPLMVDPEIPNPFSLGEEGYPLLLELFHSRGMSSKTVLFLGPPTRMKLDLAQSVSVFYNIPLLTRRNIMKEWLKLLQQIQEADTISNTFNKRASETEETEKEDEKLRLKDPVLEEMKQIVNDNNNCDVNRNWLLLTLHIILRTVRYRRIGYVLCDIPLSEKDAEFLFNNRTDVPDPRPFDFVAETAVIPKTVIYMDTMKNDAHENLQLSKDKVLSDDWNDFWKYKSKEADAQEFFKKRLHKVHRVTTRDEFLLERVVEIIGAPSRTGGALMYQSLFSHMLEEKITKPEQTAQVAHVRQFFNIMQQKGLDLAAGITHQCLPSLTDWPKPKLKHSLQPYYVGYRHYPTRKQTLRSAAGPYREVRRKWSKRSRFFNQMPTDGNRVMWKKARKFWAPQDKTKEYIIHFEATCI